jgi:NDP-sugar pyrophosphorylase family protein
MRAMIFAAGLGTRLKPLTDQLPKALVEVNGTTLLEHAVRKLEKAGITEIIVNVHHHAGLIIDFLKRKNNFGLQMEISDESDQLLDTGGGLKKATWFFKKNETFLLYNVDVLTDLDLNLMAETHAQGNSLVTLAVRDRKTSRYFLFDDTMNLCGWKNVDTSKKIISRTSEGNYHSYAFSGVHIVSPEIFNLITENGVFSLTEVYLRLATYHKIIGYPHNSGYWLDAGSPEKLNEARQLLRFKDFGND